jgi:hypothetical protein
MPIATVADFLDSLRALPLLDVAEQTQVAALPAAADIKTLGAELIRRGSLTPFQANQIARGRGGDLVLDHYVLIDLLGKGGMAPFIKPDTNG